MIEADKMTPAEREKLTREIERGNDEDKQAICTALCAALQLTRAGRAIEYIEYDRDKEVATVHYSDRLPVEVNVACDSGRALIYDIICEV